MGRGERVLNNGIGAADAADVSGVEDSDAEVALFSLPAEIRAIAAQGAEDVETHGAGAGVKIGGDGEGQWCGGRG